MSAATFAGDLVPSISIENLVNQRAAVLERFSQMAALVIEAQEMASRAGIGIPTVCLNAGYSRSVEFRINGNYADELPKLIDYVRTTVDRGGWAHLMLESGMRSLMDAKARKEWDEQLEAGKFPELTRENIAATFEALHGSRADMFERGVIEVFRGLSWRYQTNQPFRFGKRLIVTHVFYSHVDKGRRWISAPCGPNADRLDDLVRVLSILDGKPEPDYRNGLYHAISAAHREGFRDLELPYFSVRWFRNGNLHLTFTRPDLVERMNGILTKHHPDALPHDRRGK